MGYIIAICVIAFIAFACLIGLMVTGKVIGWGPFASFKWDHIPQHVLSEKEYSYETQDKTILVDGEKIRGTLYLSHNGKEKQRIVIVSHGYGQSSVANTYVYKSFARSSLSVFAFDYRGGSVHARSEGKCTDMSILTEKKDLEAVIEEVKSWSFVDQDRIMVMGYSQGGLVAGLTVSERKDIERLLLIFPAFSMPKEIIDAYKNKEVPSTIHRMGMKIGKKYVTDILSLPYDVYEEASKYKGKTVIIHGTKDHLVPYESSVKLSHMYKCELVTLEGADHGFAGTEYDLPFLKKSYEFLVEE